MAEFTDADVKREIDRMVRFIQEEAKEKVNEIMVKAEEEFSIDKGRIVQQERLKMIAAFERKEKQVETDKKIQHSNALNQARLRLLRVQEDLLEKISKDTQSRLAAVTQDKAKYEGILRDLLVEGLLVMLEENVEVSTRKADADLIKKLFPAAIQEVKAKAKIDVRITFVDSPLADSSQGGVELCAQNGKIRVVNTLERRLSMVFDQMLPVIRYQLFGPSTSRVYFD